MNAPRHPREASLLATIFVLNAIEFLQTGMIAFGAAPIMGEIGASPEEFTLITATYAVVAIAAISKMGWFVERVGWRRFVQASVVLYIAGAVICGTSSGVPQFLVGRAVMGMGGAAFMTSARILINLMPPSPRRFLGIKVFATALTIGTGAAPWLASLFVAHGHWNGIFALLSALAVLAAGLAQFALPTDLAAADRRTKAHPLALLTMLVGCFLGIYALLRASYDFYADALPLLLAIVVGTGAVLLYVRHQVTHERPTLVLKRLLQPRYLSGVALFTGCYIVLGASGYMLPFLMQRGLGFPWEVVGGVQGAGLIVTLPLFWIIAFIVPRRPAPRKFYLAGFGALALSGWLLTRITPEAGLWTEVLPAIAAYGAFIILVMPITALQTFSDLQRDEMAFNHGQQVKNMLSQFGIAFGIAAAALGTQWRTSEHVAVLTTRFSSGDAVFTQAAGQLGEQFAASHGAQAAQVALAALTQQLEQQAALLSALDYFGFLAAVALVMAAVMTVQRVLK
jgi:DHA2 family multidrug resistance protein